MDYMGKWECNDLVDMFYLFSVVGYVDYVVLCFFGYDLCLVVDLCDNIVHCFYCGVSKIDVVINCFEEEFEEVVDVLVFDYYVLKVIERFVG